MSSFYEITKHPQTGRWENAEWLDNYFGPHQYGVRFPDGQVFNPGQVETKPDNQPDTTIDSEAVKMFRKMVEDLVTWHTLGPPNNRVKLIDDIMKHVPNLIAQEANKAVQAREQQLLTELLPTKGRFSTAAYGLWVEHEIETRLEKYREGL